MRSVSLAATLTTATLLAACGDTAKLSVEAGTGPQPQLPPPTRTLVPTVNVAKADPWPAGTGPQAAPGTRVNAFATGLDHPRWLHVLPNGDVLVAESNAPPRPADGQGIKGRVMKFMMKRAGAATPSANRITLLRDTNGDGVADERSVFLQNLNSPFGMALIGDQFYIANTDALVRVTYPEGAKTIDTAPVRVADLPGGELNHHWTKSLIASPDGSKLYATVGSNSNVAENGMAAEEGRAAIWEIDAKTGVKRLYATGLRNPNGMAWEPSTNMLWTVVNERDEIGSDLVPDYMTSVRDGGFYGWPYSYFGRHVDERVKPPRPDLVATALVPDYALGPHTASLGLAWSGGTSLPAAYAQGMFIGQHGSWNRKPHSGYKVIFVPFQNGKPSGAPLDLLTGFLGEGERAHGRPVGVALDRQGALLVADDVGNVVWRVSAAAR
jgi:glucose/arabinose dehydrogenase